MVHVEVKVDELGLLKLDNLHCDDERDGDEIVIQDDEGQDILEEFFSNVIIVSEHSAVLLTFNEVSGCRERISSRDASRPIAENIPRPVSDAVSTRYHCSFEKAHYSGSADQTDTIMGIDVRP
jgi:hypothetical protein